jgi:hypothetical protein
MFKFKCNSRSKLLIYVDDEIKEIYPNQIVEFHQFINHPYLIEIKKEENNEGNFEYPKRSDVSRKKKEVQEE